MSCLYDLVRIPIYRRCEGYYLRWYYNGWHYWYFYQGRIGFNTEGEKYRTLGTQTLTIGTGQITEAQANAIRTLMNTREIYIYTDAGWGAVRAVHSPLVVYDHVTHGYEMEFTIVIGSRAISITGFSPVTSLPTREPDPQCELDIAVAGQIWMCDNWDAAYPGSKVYNDDEDNRAALGGLYTYEQVMTPGFVPDGWHVPTAAEWTTLITACGGAAAAGGVLKEIGFTRWNAPNTGAVDTYGYAAVGGGYSSPSAYGGVYDIGMFWTADPYEMPPLPANTFARYVHMNHDTAEATLAYIPRNYYMCLRLIKNYYCPACVALAATNVGNSNFTANWTAVTGATGYYLDVSTDPAFGSFVGTYHNLYVGNVLTYDITGLTPGVTYYYRMRAETVSCISTYSNSITQATPGALLLTSRGDGLGVGYLSITTTAGVTLSLTGTARFYSDAAGTLNESITWTPAAGTNTRYIRVPSGTAYLNFSDITKLTAFGSLTTYSSGSSAWSWNSLLTMDNIPNLDMSNWNFPDCTNICTFYSAFTSFTGSLSLFNNVIKLKMDGSGFISGDLSDLNAACTTFSESMSGLITGDLADMPAAMLQFHCITNNTITGDVTDLPAGITYLGVWGSNTITGDCANLPATLTNLTLYGNTTLGGDITDLPAALTSISVSGDNVLSGNLTNFSATISSIYIYGENTISGDLVNCPPSATQFRIGGFNTITGGFTGLPASLLILNLSGANTVTGDLADMPAALQQISITSTSASCAVTGDLSDLTNSVTNFIIGGQNSITGDLSTLPTSLGTLDVSGVNTITGDIADIPITCGYIGLGGNNTITDYTGKSWLRTGYHLRVIPTGAGGLSAAEIDQLLIDVDTDCPFTIVSATYKVITLQGTNAAPTATSAAARASLIAKGVTLTTN